MEKRVWGMGVGGCNKHGNFTNNLGGRRQVVVKVKGSGSVGTDYGPDDVIENGPERTGGY